MQASWLWDEKTISRMPALLLVLGAAERFAWLLLGGLGYAQGEASNVAIAFARTGTIGDVFARGSGLTAHLNPLMPAFAGSVYALLGVRSTPAELVLASVSILCTMASGWVFYRAAELAGMARSSRLVALAIFCLVPLNPQLEAVTFRTWEGALAALLSGWALLLIMRADIAARFDMRSVVAISALAAVLFFVSPPLGLACYANAAILMSRRVPFARWPARIAAATIVLAAVMAPWTVRNYEVFGKIVPLRSNFGLELALANHEKTQSGLPDHTVFVERLREIHPLESQEAFDRMQAAGGEIAYAKALGAESQLWIAAHPSEFAILCAKHMMQFYFPPAWQWDIYGHSSRGTMVKLALSWSIALFGLLGALAALILWRGTWLYVACVTLVPVLPYAIVQPVSRYRYIVLLPLLFLAVQLVQWLFARIRAREDAKKRVLKTCVANSGRNGGGRANDESNGKCCAIADRSAAALL